MLFYFRKNYSTFLIAAIRLIERALNQNNFFGKYSRERSRTIAA
jgi:hypothetical protein